MNREKRSRGENQKKQRPKSRREWCSLPNATAERIMKERRKEHGLAMLLESCLISPGPSREHGTFRTNYQLRPSATFEGCDS